MVLKKFTWPAELTLNLIGGKWKGLLLNHLLTGESKRFGELKRLSPGISAKILAKHLKELEFDGLITRMVVGTDKPRIVYAPTSRSRSLEPILSAIRQWGMDHLGAYGPESAAEESARGASPALHPDAEPSGPAWNFPEPERPLAEAAGSFRKEASPTASSSHSVAS
ncbi:MAG TPA: helix-turn-helix domain-containing protein [Fibrobacteria bacterium]|nr:helix-turn-helix domain-containing protein [Fibrobacteria bacterium]